MENLMSSLPRAPRIFSVFFRSAVAQCHDRTKATHLHAELIETSVEKA